MLAAMSRHSKYFVDETNESERNTKSQQKRPTEPDDGSDGGNESRTVLSTSESQNDASIPGRKSGKRPNANESTNGRGLSGSGNVRGGQRSSSSFQITEDIAKGGNRALDTKSGQTFDQPDYSDNFDYADD